MWQTEKLPYHYFGLDAIFFLYSVAVNEIKNPQRDSEFEDIISIFTNTYYQQKRPNKQHLFTLIKPGAGRFCFLLNCFK